MTINSEIVELSPDDHFNFDCHPGVACFNQCCRDLSQALTPYDVLRLRRHLDMTSSAFLEQFTRRGIGPQTGLPVVSLRPLEPLLKACPFVTASGCRVYPDRPSSCRMYPVFRAAARQRETGVISERFFLIQEPHCQGFDRGRQWTVREWITNQELEDYNRANDYMLALISVKNQRMPGVLDAQTLEWVYTACYDIDRFREVMPADKDPVGPAPGAISFSGAIRPPRTEASSGGLSSARTASSPVSDDLARLALGMAFVRRNIFGEPPEADHGVI